MIFSRHIFRVLRASLIAAAWTTAFPTVAVEMEYVIVGDTGNNPDQNNLGSVAYPYRIGKYEVTNAQYAEFLNAKASSDPYGLYDGRMASEPHGGIERSEGNEPFTYSVKTGYANKPVVYVNFWDALRFTNWLNNGQGSGDTESGAYTLAPNPSDPPYPANYYTVTRAATATVFIPNENEWYKAAYFNAGASGPMDDDYWRYPTQSDAIPNSRNGSASDADSANFFRSEEPNPDGVNDGYAVTGSTISEPGQQYLTPVGAFTQAHSRYGTFDQGGNVNEWTETLDWVYRFLRGGHYGNGAESLDSFNRGYSEQHYAFESLGFRVAASLPPPDVPPAARGNWRILALGDSITQSSVPRLSYRYYLWMKLIEAGVQFDFVGSLTDIVGFNGNDPANWPPYQGRFFDQHHEGRSGKRSDEILAGLQGSPSWMSSYTPDIVLLHAGTNDALQDSPTDTAENIRSIIDVLRGRNPNVIILLAKLIPTADVEPNVRIGEINEAIADLAVLKHQAASPVVVVDQNAGFDLATDSYDGLHPNALGDQKIAKKWFEALQIYTLKAQPGADAQGHLNVRFMRIQSPSDLAYTVEVSSDLQQWFSGPAETEEVGEPVNHYNGTETVVIRDRKSTATDGQRFIRLRLSYGPSPP